MVKAIARGVGESAPTMIIPSGTEIEVDPHGQLSIRTPGNLVLQNSGSYGTIESLQGSIRIEPNVQVEAVQVKCAEVCYVQGSLTAWKVRAREMQLEDSARAHVILQETDSLQVGKEARMVGNFSSENELFLLFSRFAKQMRSLPFAHSKELALEAEPARALADMEPMAIEGKGRQGGEAAASTNGAPVESPAEAIVDLPDSLFFALVLLERESEKPGGGPRHHQVVDELLRMLREREIGDLRSKHQDLFSQVAHPTEDLRRVQQLISDHFG